MAPTQKRTRQQIRQSIGGITGAINQDAGAFTFAASSGTSNTFQNSDYLVFGAANEHRGKWISIATSSAGSSNTAGTTRRITASETSSGRLTIAGNFPASITSSVTAELWDEDLSPQVVNDFIDQAITEVTRKGAVPVTSDSLHTGGNIRQFNLSSNLVGIQNLEYRFQYTGEQLTTLDAVMGASGGSVSLATDSEDYREGSAAAKINVGSGTNSATVLGESSFTTKDLRGYTHLEFWVKSNVTTTASNLQVRLGENSTARETISLPILNSDSWTYLTLALANPELDDAITRFIPMTGASDGGSATLWFDDVKAVRSGAENYMKVPRQFWSLDKNNRQIRLSNDIKLPYAKLRFTGVRRPNLFTTDTGISEVDSQYIINSATAKALRARADRRGADRDAAYVQADRYEALAQTQRQRMSAPSNVRWLSDD